MPRIPPIERIPFLSLEMEEGELPSYTTSASMSTLFQVMAHRPNVARASMQLLEAAMSTGTVDGRLKELLAVRVSQVNHCFY